MYPTNQQQGPPKRSLKTQAMAMIAAVSLAFVAPSGAFAQTAPAQTHDQVIILDENGAPYSEAELAALEWVPADQAATDEARGGAVWVVVLAGHVAIRVCLRNARTCMGTIEGAVRTFSNLPAARRWVCTNYRRLC